MTNRYATPAAFLAALEQRLRTRSAGDGLELQRVRQLVVFEQFLARVFDEAGDSVILKGGFVLELRLERARTTKDLDLWLTGRSDLALEMLRSAGRRDGGDFLVFAVDPDPHHPAIDAEGTVYEGLRFRVEARLAEKVYARPFSVDVAFAEPLTGQPDRLTGGDWLAFAGIMRHTFRVYPLETHIAEKLHAYTLPRTRPNSRVKDLPDIALLASVRALDASTVRAAIEATWGHRSTHPIPTSFPNPDDAWSAPYLEMAKVNGLPWADLLSVTDAARKFLDPVLGGASGTLGSRHVVMAMKRRGPAKGRLTDARFEEMVEEATVDAYGESEETTGWFTMIDENLAVPFKTTVLGVAVTVEKVDLTRDERIVAVCRRGRDRQLLPILDLPIPSSTAGAEWIEAYRRWRGGEE
jgi:hypothetical protein